MATNASKIVAALAYATASLFLAACDGDRAGPTERDVWFAVSSDDQPCGYLHVVVEERPNGEFAYTRSTRVLTQFADQPPKHVTRYDQWVVTRDYRVVSVESVLWLPSGETRIVGHARDGKLVIVSSDTGKEDRKTLSLDKGTIPQSCLEDWLRALPAGTTSAAVRVISEDDWTTRTIHLTRKTDGASSSTWSLESEDGSTATWRLDEANWLREFECPRLKAIHRRCSAEEALNFQPRHIDWRTMLRFPIDKRIEDPERLSEMTVALTWEKVPLDQLAFEDSRQSIIEKSAQDEHFTVTVRLQTPPELPADQEFPLNAKEHALYLKETAWIKPHDERIAAMAEDTVTGKTSVLEAVTALSHRVEEHIITSTDAASPVATDVLEHRRGACVHHATLFASLARAVGIPTRIVRGERLGEDMWVAHAWNEVYIGQWMPVDVGFDEVGGSIKLLKLQHGASAADMEQVSYQLCDNLGISILGYKLRPSRLAEKYTTGVQGKVYTSVELACRITAPEGWEVFNWSEDNVFFSQIPAAHHATMFLAGSTGIKMSPRLLALVAAKFKQGERETDLLAQGPYGVGGQEGYRVRFRKSGDDEQKAPQLTTFVAWRCGRIGYYAQLDTDESIHDEHLPALEELLASFESLEADPDRAQPATDTP